MKLHETPWKHQLKVKRTTHSKQVLQKHCWMQLLSTTNFGLVDTNKHWKREQFKPFVNYRMFDNHGCNLCAFSWKMLLILAGSFSLLSKLKYQEQHVTQLLAEASKRVTILKLILAKSRITTAGGCGSCDNFSSHCLDQMSPRIFCKQSKPLC